MPNASALFYDAYKLKGICAYRLGDINESIRMYNLANRVKQEARERNENIKTIESEQ